MLVSSRLQPCFFAIMLLSSKRLENMCRLQLKISTAFISALLQGGHQGPTPHSSRQDPQFSASIHPLAAILLLVLVLSLVIFPRRGREGLRRGACGVTTPSFNSSSDLEDWLPNALEPFGSGHFDLAAVQA